MAVSVIVTTRNRCAFLERAVRSVLNQTHRNLELIVVDDCSTDGTAEFCQGVDDRRFRWITSSRQLGGGGARNLGATVAQYEYVAFLDDDDWWHASKLARQLEVFTQNPSVGLVYTGFDMIRTRDGTTIRSVFPRERGLIEKPLYQTNCIGTTSTVMMTRSLLRACSGFDESLASCQDWDLWLRASRLSEVDFVSDTLVYYTVHSQRISTNFLARTTGLLSMLQKHETGFRQIPSAYASHLCELADLFAMTDNFTDSARYYRASWHQMRSWRAAICSFFLYFGIPIRRIAFRIKSRLVT